MVPSTSPNRSAPGRLLNSTRDYAEEVVATVVPHVSYKRQELLRSTTLLAHWAAHRGLRLEHSTLFTDATIDGFIREGLPQYSDASRGNVRSQLRRVREVLQHGGSPVRPERLSAAEPLEPYSTDEQRQFTTWADRQKTPEFRRDARTILALGLGAGLGASEIGEVRGMDVLVDASGVQVRVQGERPRTVQLLRRQEARLVKATQAVEPSQYLIRPGRAGTAKNLVSNIVERGIAGHLGPRTQRMRTTWLVHHLNAGVHVGVLMEAAGLESLKGLTRYLAFLPEVPTRDARASLRG